MGWIASGPLGYVLDEYDKAKKEGVRAGTMARLEDTVALLLREGYRIDCNGQDVGSVADLDRCLQDGKGGELRINFEYKRATIDQETKTVFLNE